MSEAQKSSLAESWYGTPKRGSLAPRLWRAWRRGLTESGRLLLIVFFVAGAVALSVGVHFPLYQFVVALIALLFTGIVGGMIYRPRVRIERFIPRRVACGTVIEIRALLVAKGPLASFDVSVSERVAAKQSHAIRLEERPLAVVMLRAGDRAELTYTLETRRRGSYDLEGPEATTTFPLGLFRVAHRVKAPQRLLVYPRFRPLARIDLPVGRKHQPGGLQLVSQVGDSEEFIGNREYRPGDRMRDLDQRAWARTGAPVVREFRQEYLSRVALVVDTYARRGRGKKDGRALEAAISLGAAVADALSRQEYVVDVFAAGPDLYHFQAGRSLAYLDSILDVLACIEANPNNPFPVLGPAILDAIEQISTAVVVLLDWDEDRLRFVRTLKECGVELRIVVVREGAPTSDPLDANVGRVTVLTPAQVAEGLDVL